MDGILENLQRIWWVFALRGVAAIAIGIMAFAWPQLTLVVLVTLFGAYVLVDGIVGLIDVVRHRDRLRQVWPLVLEAVLGVVFGGLTLLWPGTTALVLLMFIAAWSILGGILRIVLAFQIRHEITGEWILILSGLLSLVFGGLLVAMPHVGLVTLVWVVGFYVVLFGALFLYLALRLRRLGNGRTV